MHVRQEPGQRRRWFESDQMELIVWFQDHSRPTGFQIIYSLRGEERALTWLASAGFRHSIIDTGDDSPLKNLTPTLGAGGAVPWNHIRELFHARCESLAEDIKGFVLGQLAETQ
jgi:hypothetical protein